MLRIATLLLILAACGSRAAPGATASGGGATTDVATAARAVVESWRQGWELRSTDALGALYPHDLDVIVVDQGRAQLGWTAIEAYLSSKLAPAKEIHVKLDDLQVLALGSEAAAVSATMTRETSDGVSNIKEVGVITMALRATPDGWRIVSEHYSHPPTAQ